MDLSSGGAAALCGLAFYVAWCATHDLAWPPEADLWRDMGAARALAAGTYPEDPAYLGEIWWYNPLLPALAALTSHLSGCWLETLYARGGAYVNMLVPLAYYVLARALTGRWAALASLAAYLFFFNSALESTQHATYSPWLFPYNQAQFFAYLTAACWCVFERRPSRTRYAVIGLLLGITFLAHTAPALVLAMAITLHSGLHMLVDPPLRRDWFFRLLVAGVMALGVSLVFFAPIALRYRFHIQNPDPSSLGVLHLRDVLADLATPRGAVSLLGAALLIRKQALHGIYGSLLAAAALALAESLLAQKIGWPGIVPSFHFQLYVSAVLMLGFGYALSTLVRQLEERWRCGRAWRGLVVIGLVVAIILKLPAYISSADLVALPASSRYVARNEVAVSFYRWLRKRKRTEAFLSSAGASILIVGAGHPVAVTFETYSNPYVPLEERQRGAEAIRAAWVRGDAASVVTAARERRIRYLVLEDEQDATPPGATMKKIFDVRSTTADLPPEPMTTLEYTGFPPTPPMKRVQVFALY